MQRLESDDKIGMLGDPHLITGIGDCIEADEVRARAELELREIGLAPYEKKFIAGTMFIVRAALLAPLQGHFGFERFEDSSDRPLATLAHVLERVLGYLVWSQGVRIEGWYKVLQLNELMNLIVYSCVKLVRGMKGKYAKIYKTDSKIA